MKLRKDLSASGLWQIARTYFTKNVTDPRKLTGKTQQSFSLTDCLMSGAALLSLKFSSLLQFDTQTRMNPTVKHNLRNSFQVEKAPSDTQLREILDHVNPREMRRLFKVIFAVFQRGKLLEEFVYLNGHYLVALDETGYFSSSRVFCKNCCQKQH